MKAATIAVLASVAMAAGLPPAAAQDAARAQEGAAAEAGEILDRLGRYLASLEAMEFDCKTISETSGDGLLMRYETRYSVAIRRPASAALRHDGGMAAPTFVTDGATLHVYLPTINKYTKGPAPQRTDDLVSSHADDFGFFEHITQTPGLRTLLSADPVAVIDGVKPLARSMGIEEVDGVRAHRIRVDRSPPGDLWIAAGDTPWLVRAELAADADEWNMGGFWKDVKSAQVLIVSNWRTPDSIPDERFAFAPPEGAEEVDDLMAAMMEDFGFDGGFDMEDEAHALLGEPAPDFEIETLDGPAGTLSALSEQGRVVVLDFWATWCPPCREGLPIIAEVMKEYPEDKAIFYAVNVQEDRGAIERFLESQNLKIHVALDGDGAIAQQYGVSGIPQTVIIGKDGAVEAIHVGLSPDLKERLKREVDAVLAGEKLSDAAPGGAGAAIAELPDDENLEALWSLNGPWSALAVDRDTGQIHAITGRGDRMGAISAGGKLLNETRLNGPSSATIRIARLRPDGAATVAFTNPWGRSVEAFDAEGKRLWDYTVGLGVNDIWAADLTGDGGRDHRRLQRRHGGARALARRRSPLEGHQHR
jgi:thiol-disulfide isomerase/thioredoxin